MTPADAIANLESAVEIVCQAQAVLGENREIWDALAFAEIYTKLALRLTNESLDAAKGARG